MGNAISSAAAFALCTAISAIELIKHLDPQPGSAAGTTAAAQAQARALGGAVGALLTLAAVGGLLASVGLIHRRVRLAGAPAAAGGGNRRLSSEFDTFMLCASAGSLLLLLAPAPGGADPGAGRELGLAALRAIPAVATASFFIGMLLIIVGHIRAGGEGGGGAVAPIEGPVGFLSKMAVAAAAMLVCLMAVALSFMSRLGGSSSI